MCGVAPMSGHDLYTWRASRESADDIVMTGVVHAPIQ